MGRFIRNEFGMVRPSGRSVFQVSTRRFEGFAEGVNLVPFDGGINNGSYLALEDEILGAHRAGEDVRMEIELVYDATNGSVRPDEITVNWSRNGVDQLTRQFP